MLYGTEVVHVVRFSWCERPFVRTSHSLGTKREYQSENNNNNKAEETNQRPDIDRTGLNTGRMNRDEEASLGKGGGEIKTGLI